ncbi:MAG: SUMF1/EgtB/PvdO family nonheme iron enzyme [Thermodesulfobacteriota bacterium]
MKAKILAIICLASLCATFLAWGQDKGIRRNVTAITRQGQNLALYGDYYALVIGASKYQHWPMLQFAAQDAQDVSARLKSLGFNVKTVLDPNSDQLKAALDDIAYGEGQTRNRGLLIFFSGHGDTEGLADSTEMGYIVPVDCPLRSRDPRGFARLAVSMNDIEALARKINSKHVLMVFDSCFSGSVFSMLKEPPPEISEKSARPVRQFITAGGAKETVPDRSVFKVSFLQGLEGEADLNKDGYVTGSELGMYLQSAVVNYSRGGQHPQYGKIRNPELDKGDFIFVLGASGEGSGGPSSPPPVQTAGGVSPEELIQQREKEKQEWAEWQKKMETEYAKAEQYEKSPSLTEKEKEEIWSAFLLNFGTDNKYSRNDELLREKAKQRQAFWRAKAKEGETPPSFTNSLGQKFVLIPSGTFTMGSPSSESGRDDDETQHQVTISRPFYMQTTEVTQGQWRSVMGSNPSHFKNCGDDCPVESVSWNDAQEFIGRLNAKEGGNKYRLPSEAEWEYAARAGSRTAYSFGESQSELGQYAWYDGNSGGQTHPVGRKRPNAWGFYDMHGNVWEWCQDWYGVYPSGAVTDPQGPSSGSDRVHRGGSWLSYAQYCRSAFRAGLVPGDRFNLLGFRLVRRAGGPE